MHFIFIQQRHCLIIAVSVFFPPMIPLLSCVSASKTSGFYGNAIISALQNQTKNCIIVIIDDDHPDHINPYVRQTTHWPLQVFPSGCRVNPTGQLQRTPVAVSLHVLSQPPLLTAQVSAQTVGQGWKKKKRKGWCVNVWTLAEQENQNENQNMIKHWKTWRWCAWRHYHIVCPKLLNRFAIR